MKNDVEHAEMKKDTAFLSDVLHKLQESLRHYATKEYVNMELELLKGELKNDYAEIRPYVMLLKVGVTLLFTTVIAALMSLVILK
jgi:hypothetical protein